ncbi:PREDICTED: uncharacterized protein LOC105460071, partial [Wasmannia auropunctata]|uniref:uncharacterized protein LOC105460071 n=1 Tax=Wasmannia auropunctata TaxID=64793 RepID=UPI0005EE533D
MLSVRKCLDSLLPHNIIGFTNETEMINAYTRAQAQARFITVAVIFEQYNKHTLKYKLRHSQEIPNNLYQSALEIDRMSMSPTIYFKNIPLAQVQICVDEAFIKGTAANSNVKMSIQQMPYPPYIKMDVADTVMRTVISAFVVMAFIIPLCIEVSYSTKEKFIGVN